MAANPAYDPGRDETRWPAVSEECCNTMARKYKWKQPRSVADRYENTDSRLLPVNCVFLGDCQFPKRSIDHTAGEADDD